MRLIDADLLSEAMHENVSAPYEDASWAKENCLAEIEAAQTVDAVPVVRCRECKHYDTADFDGNILCGCTLHSAMVDITPDSFCSYGDSYGERKEGADNG